MAQGPTGAELAQMPQEPSVLVRFAEMSREAAKNFLETSNENPDRTALGVRVLGGLAMTFGAVEYFAIGSQTTGELIGDSIFELGGAGLIAASYLPGRNN